MAQVSGGGGAPPDGSQIVSEAEKFAGFPYVYGATGPSSFDCSGLVQYVYGQLGVPLPRTSEDQWGAVKRIPASQVGPGDLVFAQFPGDNASPGHVGIYVGDGKVISAQDPQLGVGYSSLASWGNNIVGYGKVTGTSVTSTGTGSGGGGGGGDSLPSSITSTLQDVLNAVTGGTLGVGTGALGDLDSLGGIGAALTAMAKEFEGVGTALTWLTLPSNWTRIFAGLAGGAFLAAGVWFLIREAGNG